MRCAIAENAEFVKKVCNLGREQPLERQPMKQVRLRFLTGLKQSGLRGDKLREKLTKLTQFDLACIGIVVKITFSERTQSHELNIVLLEKKEIACFCLLGTSIIRTNTQIIVGDYVTYFGPSMTWSSTPACFCR
jgi:hypothetical protein